ncbi:Retrovirus-related Pol polyprotein from transposon TNT 1-94 [Vitis vinifera]|uniref:Retrovirus-related Pol polyprotein from transposon TNT 1-94 n=1 Tax=Vitis vinifera TaxID=29760 RepID=A0A438GTC2_VITVI|nr:Retrovirus-related Pol polyprotein from transposon TNT 1-94 [Vitis vinifera]
MTLHNLDLALRVDEPSRVRDHIIKLKHYFNKASEMKVELSEKFLKWLILESLPTSFDVVKLTYNALKEEWTLEELMSIVVQHEVSLKKNETHSLTLVTDQIGHKQADFFKFKNWLEKKKKDTGATIHVTNSLQEMTTKGSRQSMKECVYMGDGSKVKGKMTAKTRKKKIDRPLRLRWSFNWEKPIKAVKSDRGEWGCRKEESHIVGYVPSKSVPKTPYKLWSGKKPSLHYFHVWGCKVEGVLDFIVHLIPLGSLSQTGLYTLKMKLMLIPILCLVRYFWRRACYNSFPTSHVPKWMFLLSNNQPLIKEHGDQVEPSIPVDGTEHEYDGYNASDPVSYQKAIHCPQFTSWKEAMDDEMNSMSMKGVGIWSNCHMVRFNTHNCSSTRAPIVKADKFSKAQCPQNDDEREEMRTIPYSSLVDSLMYAQVCTHPDIAFVVSMLGRYLSNPGSTLESC